MYIFNILHLQLLTIKFLLKWAYRIYCNIFEGFYLSTLKFVSKDIVPEFHPKSGVKTQLSYGKKLYDIILSLFDPASISWILIESCGIRKKLMIHIFILISSNLNHGIQPADRHETKFIAGKLHHW